MATTRGGDGSDIGMPVVVSSDSIAATLGKGDPMIAGIYDAEVLVASVVIVGRELHFSLTRISRDALRDERSATDSLAIRRGGRSPAIPSFMV